MYDNAIVIEVWNDISEGINHNAYENSIRGGLAQGVARPTRNVEVVGSSPIKGPPLFPWERNFTLIA